MSLDKMKKQAKNLLRLLPEFQREHSHELRLADCQELIARTHGFPNWHAAVERAAPNAAGTGAAAAAAAAILVLPLRIRCEVEEIVEATHAGDPERPRECRFLRIEPTGSVDAASGRLDSFMETSHWDTWEVPPAELALRMTSLCDDLVGKQPAFLDGFAHLAVGLIHLGRNDDVVARLLPVYNAIVASFPDGDRFEGRISYGDLSNRPFHRIAANLVVAAYRCGTVQGNALGSKIAKQMYNWWPNDNVGFRFMLTAADFGAPRRSAAGR